MTATMFDSEFLGLLKDELDGRYPDWRESIPQDPSFWNSLTAAAQIEDEYPASLLIAASRAILAAEQQAKADGGWDALEQCPEGASFAYDKLPSFARGAYHSAYQKAWARTAPNPNF